MSPTAYQRRGKRWHSENVPDPPRGHAFLLNSVYCASKRACIAVGADDLVSTWNGQRWSSTNP